MTTIQLTASAMGEKLGRPLSRYQMVTDYHVMRALGVDLSVRDFAKRWGISKTTAHTIMREAEEAPIVVEVTGG